MAERSIPWWAVLFSVVATETSALTFISTPGLSYGSAPHAGDLAFLQIVAGYVIGRVVIAYTLLPRYYNGQLVTAYALLERRFGVATRRFTSIVFMATRALADSVRVFATAIPIALIIGPAVKNPALVTPIAVLILGLLTIIYTYRGGMKAVVWTELVQAGVYVFGGIVAVVLLGRAVPGGWSAIFHTAGDAGKLRVIDTYMGVDRPYTLFAGLLGGAFLSMASHGADQLIVQRLLCARSLRDARRAIIGSGFAVFAQFALFLVIGLGLWAFYQGRHFDATDVIFPTYIVEHMPSGLLGLIVAAIVAATMSTHSGAINSLAAAATNDIYLPIAKLSPDDPRALRISAEVGGDVGCDSHRRRPHVSCAGDAGGRGGTVDRELHVRRIARWFLSRNFLAARDTARCAGRHERGDSRNGNRRIRKAARRGVSVARVRRSRQSRASRGRGTCSLARRSQWSPECSRRSRTRCRRAPRVRWPHDRARDRRRRGRLAHARGNRGCEWRDDSDL